MSRIAIILANLRAEGGPALGADLAAEWRAAGHDPFALLLNADDMSMAGRFEAIGVPIASMEMGLVTPRRYPVIAAKARTAFAKHRPEAIVSIPNGVHSALFLGAAVAGIKRRVVHVGNYPWHWQSNFWKYRALMRCAAPITPDLVCVTHHVAEGVATHFGRVARRVHVVPNGVDLSTFYYRGDPVRVEERPIRVLMVGRLDAGKDHFGLIDAIATLTARGVPARLQLVGDGMLRRALEEKVATEGLSQVVDIMGARRNVQELLAAADVFAFSVRPEEGLGIALVEAMAAGVPIVATNVGACREVLDNGAAGTIVPENDFRALADAIEAAARRPDVTKVHAARRRAETVYSRAAMAAEYGALCGL